MTSKKISWNGLLTSKFLSLLREKWSTKNKFSAGIAIKYNYLRL